MNAKITALTRLLKLLLLLSLFSGLLESCSPSEKAARLARREEYLAEKAARNKRRAEWKANAQKPSGSLLDRLFGTTDPSAPPTRPKRTLSEEQAVRAVISSARSYKGTPYLAGGTTRVGMDCSGLLVTCFQSADIELPRTSTMQSEYGIEIDLKNIRAGDLVFFGPSKGSYSVNHVGLVTEVKGEKEVWFIHASTSLGVMENNLYSKYYNERFIRARRPY